MIPPNFVPEIHRFPSLESTNTTAKKFAKEGAPEGTVIIAETQEIGRASNNRTWHSPQGGLYASVLLIPKFGKRPTDLGFLAGVAIAQTVKDLLPKSADVSVKWPNDCLVNWKKIAGVLCENLGDGYGNYCVVGIGLNVNVPASELTAFSQRVFPATSFMAESQGGTFDLEKIFQTLLRKLFNLYRLYHAEGFATIQFLWERNCHFIGKKIEMREMGHTEKDGRRGITTGTLKGIDESGAIVLTNDKGENHPYYTGEISCFWR